MATAASASRQIHLAFVVLGSSARPSPEARRDLFSIVSERIPISAPPALPELVAPAIAQLPSARFLMTSAFEGKRAGVLVRSVQSVADEPPLLAVALRRGHWIEPLIRDSRHFALCLIEAADRLVLRKFAEATKREPGDPFDALPLETLVSQSPVLRRSPLVFDCEVARNLDLEAECGLYVGIIVGVRTARADDGK